jgi:hypothetical protein
MFEPILSGSSSNGFNRQMSMPTNLCDHAGSVSNGFGNSRANGASSDRGNDGFRYIMLKFTSLGAVPEGLKSEQPKRFALIQKEDCF